MGKYAPRFFTAPNMPAVNKAIYDGLLAYPALCYVKEPKTLIWLDETNHFTRVVDNVIHEIGSGTTPILSELTTGLYHITGNYQITSNTTTLVTNNKELFVITDHTNMATVFDGHNITTYSYVGLGYIKDTYAKTSDIPEDIITEENYKDVTVEALTDQDFYNVFKKIVTDNSTQKIYLADEGFDVAYGSVVLPMASTRQNGFMTKEYVTDLNTVKSAITNKVDKVDGKTLTSNDFTDEYKTKVDGIEDGAEVNQNAIAQIKVGDSTISATITSDIVNIVKGNNVNISANTDDKSVTISADALTLTEVTPSTGSAKTYELKQGDTSVGKIDIPTDLVIKSGRIVKNPSGQPAGTYIELTLNNPTSDKIYINVSDLGSAYSAQENATQVQVAIADYVISATIVAGSIGSTELATSSVTNSKIANATISRSKIDSTFESQIAGIESDLSITKSNVAAMSGDVTSLVTDMPTVKSNISTLQSDVSTAQTNITQLNSNKVDKVEGKGLSTNDFTNADKNDISSLKTDKQDKLIAGANITISADGKTISATGGGGGSATVDEDALDSMLETILGGSGSVIIGQQTLISPSGTKYKLAVDDNGKMYLEEVEADE